jgi:chlorobactene glucosyltransferase
MNLLPLATAVSITVLLFFLLIATENYRHFPRLGEHARPTAPPPFVSVLIPARNEATVIARTTQHLLNQCYPGRLEVIILDDQSQDGTGVVALAAGRGDPRLHVLEGAPLPAGWVGKPWACHQLAQAAQGDLLLFTDADVAWQPDALAATVAQQQATGAGLLSVWPTQQMQSPAERLVVPLMSFALLAYLPVHWVHDLPHKQAAAANGQCLLFTRTAYTACGGHAGVRDRVLEDVLLAQRIKAAAERLRLADGAGLVQARMYSGWQSVRDGYAKNILAGHLNSIPLLLLSTLFHITLFVLPWLWLFAGFWGVAPEGWPVLPLMAVLLGIGTRACTALTARQPLRDALLMPISVLLMTRIAMQAIWWRVRYGGPVWKGRTLPAR